MPSTSKKTSSAKNAARKIPPPASTLISTELQQRCLDIFKDALWTSPDDLNTVQEVKGHLYDRDFAQAFGRPEYLRAYALRWSPSRALGYATIFESVYEHLASTEEVKVLSLGGGAGAELVGFAGLLAARATSRIDMNAVDIAEWSTVLTNLQSSITNPLKLSQYASAAAKAANQALLSDTLKHTFTHADVLQWEADTISSAMSGVQLVTIMFTLNELYASSIPKTQTLLGMITEAADHDALLLIVDSPGSYSTISINGAQKRYPMRWLVDLTLIGLDKDDESTKWTKLVSEDSQWSRLPNGLRYPVDLENMRYQLHIYQRKRV